MLGAAYMLWMYQRVMFGEVTNEKNKTLADMSGREVAVIAPLIVLAVVMGVYPKPFFDTMRASVEQTLARIPNAALESAGITSDVGRLPAGRAVPAAATGASHAGHDHDSHAGHDHDPHAGHDHGSHGGGH